MAETREDLGHGRVNQKRRTRQALMEAASRLLAAGQTPTLAQVAEAALVSRATAYRYFPSVEALLEEAFFAQEYPTVEELFADGVEDVVERVARVEEGANGLFFDHEVQVRVVVRSLLDAWLAGEEDDRPTRPGRRLVLLDAALAPLTKTLGRKRRARLRDALTLTIGTEALLATRDVCGLSVDDARVVTKWASAALVRQALLEVGGNEGG
jgi:AcrR family transcriptional regulator